MTPAYESLLHTLKGLPGLGHRSSERLAIHLLVEKPNSMNSLIDSLSKAKLSVGSCKQCGNISENETCSICEDSKRDFTLLCVVEHVTDLIAIERSAAWQGQYHVLHGKLSPIHGVGHNDLNFESLSRRISQGKISEIVLALSNDIEGQATCHYLQEEIVGQLPIVISRIGFGLPSGGGVTYADSITLRSALAARRQYE
ncbi:MAG: recombination mediator RecR [Verrucomicrobiota bacterium]|nr:recombination mediator RecR [Verrucomicrobiota bacterium]